MTDVSYPLSYLEKGEREIVRERERGRERERKRERERGRDVGPTSTPTRCL